MKNSGKKKSNSTLHIDDKIDLICRQLQAIKRGSTPEAAFNHHKDKIDADWLLQYVHNPIEFKIIDIYEQTAIDTELYESLREKYPEEFI